jgi:hypothetical protein
MDSATGRRDAGGVKGRHMPAAGVMVLVVSIALMFGTSVDPYSLMILATATYFLVWLASFGVTWYGRRRPGPTSDTDQGRSGDSVEHDLPARP